MSIIEAITLIAVIVTMLILWFICLGIAKIIDIIEDRMDIFNNGGK